jgi:hypothetical protein
MKTFVTISAGVLLALSCVATSESRLHANWEGQTQSEPSNYNPDYNSQTNTQNWDNSCLHCGATTGLAQNLPSYESNGFPITPLQAQAVSPKGMQQQLSDPTLTGGGIQASAHQAAVLGAAIQMAQKPLPTYESNGFHITPLEVVLFVPNEVKERHPPAGGGMGG